MTIKFEILNRWSGKVQFTAEIDCNEDASHRIKVGLSLAWAYKSDAVLRGADLSDAVLRGADLSDAVLRGAVLRDADLRGADLRDADLSDADLSDADLRGAVLRGAVLRDADLSGADLSDADLRGAVLSDADLSDVPKIPDIHKVVYAAASQTGALDMGQWHKCETTHCRAGWVVTLAGEAGAALEYGMGTSVAAALIYLASDPALEKVPNFYADNGEALADMKRLAEQEV